MWNTPEEDAKIIAYNEKKISNYYKDISKNNYIDNSKNNGFNYSFIGFIIIGFSLIIYDRIS